MSEKKSQVKNILGGAISLTVSSIIVKIIGLVFKVPLSYILTDEGMGFFNSAYTVYTFFYIVSTAGVPKSISILTSKAESEGNLNKVNYIYKTAFSMFFCLGILLTLLLLILSKPISTIIGNRGSYLTMLVIAPSILFVCASGVLRGYLNGKLMLFPIAISELISSGAKLILGLLFALLGYRNNLGLEVISALSILGLTLGSFFSYIYLWIYKKSKERNKNTRQKCYIDRRSIAKDIFKIALPLTVTSSITSLGGIVDLLTVMNRLSSGGYSELQSGILYGNYTTLVLPMFNLIGTVISPLSAVILPLVSRDDFWKNKTENMEKLSLFFQIISILSVPFAILFFFIPDVILSIIFENGSALMAAPLLSCLAPSVILLSYLTIINTILEASGRAKLPLISLIFGIIIKYIVSFLVIGNESYGILGAPIGTVFSYFVSFFISYYYLFNILKVRIKLFRSLLLTVLIGFISFLPGILLIRSTHLSNAIVLLILLLISFVYLAINLVIFNLLNIKNKKKMAIYTKI